MEDRMISCSTLCAAAGWLVGLVLILVDVFSDHELGELGVWVTSAAAVAQLHRGHKEIRHGEINAFNLGRDSQQIRAVK